MKNFLKILGKRVIQGIAFGLCYALISYFMGDEIKVLSIVYSSISYVIVLCIINAITPCLKKIFGFDKK